MTDIAIAHDAFTSDGGAERVAARLAMAFDAPLYCTRLDESVVPDGIDATQTWNSRSADLWNERSWWMPRTVYWAGRHLYRRQRATHAPELHDYDVIIQTKGPQWPYVPRTEQTLIRYVHSPPRRHYDRFYTNSDSFASRMWSMMHRIMDGPPKRYPDVWIANSDVVKRRIQLYYDIDESDINVVYPPVEVNGYPDSTDGGYYLYLGRLASNKRIGLVCDIARETDCEIVVAGDGPENTTVKNAPGNITYHGYVNEEEKRKLLSEARATLFFAEEEDFGIVPIESMAAGTPVIGVSEGFTKYQIQDGENGHLCSPTTTDAVAAINRHERNGVEWDNHDLQNYAGQFSGERFDREIKHLVEKTRANTTVKANIDMGGVDQ